MGALQEGVVSCNSDFKTGVFYSKDLGLELGLGLRLLELRFLGSKHSSGLKGFVL